MNLFLVVGTLTLVLGLVGYGFGIVTPYPARELSVPAIMVGIAMIAMRKAVTDPEVAS